MNTDETRIFEQQFYDDSQPGLFPSQSSSNTSIFQNPYYKPTTLCFFGKVFLKIPKNKHQISNKFEAPITKFSDSSINLLTIGIWDLFVIWVLEFAALPRRVHPWLDLFGCG